MVSTFFILINITVVIYRSHVMAINVNDLLQNALIRVGIAADGETPTPDQVTAAAKDLESVIAELNTENFLMENYETYDAYVSKVIKFAVLPERWFRIYDIDALLNRISSNKVEVGDIYRLDIPYNGMRFATIKYEDGSYVYHMDEEWNGYMNGMWPTFEVQAVPDRVMSVARFQGNRYIELNPVNKMAIDSVVHGHLATMYSVKTEHLNVEFPHDEEDPNYEPYNVEYFVIEVDSNIASKFRVTVLKGIEHVDITGSLPISRKYESLIEDGLCVKLCQRYKYMEMKEDFERDFRTIKNTISRINSTNNPIVYKLNNRGYNDNYFNFVGGNFWS